MNYFCNQRTLVASAAFLALSFVAVGQAQAGWYGPAHSHEVVDGTPVVVYQTPVFHYDTPDSHYPYYGYVAPYYPAPFYYAPVKPQAKEPATAEKKPEVEKKAEVKQHMVPTYLTPSYVYYGPYYTTNGGQTIIAAPPGVMNYAAPVPVLLW
ncbi:MAG: hypothetical protein HQL68_13060 [Magnetococcales bacterium]|nr:hypothetical protein [Magnetococcales bacterium]